MKKDIFTISIYRSSNYNPTYNKLILEELEVCKQQKGVVKSNVGGFQTPDIKNKKVLEETSQLVVTHLSNYLSIIQDTQLKPVNIRLGNCWINENYQHSSNTIHTHAGSSFSGVFYLKTPVNSGKLEFYNENSPVNLMSPHYSSYISGSSDFHSVHMVTPKINDIIIFPSYLKHAVSQSMSDEPRISLSFNLEVMPNG